MKTKSGQFVVRFRRISDADPAKYGGAWGLYEWDVGGVFVQRHCRDDEPTLKQLSRVLADPELEGISVSAFEQSNPEIKKS